jgi:hypothetical protein
MVSNLQAESQGWGTEEQVAGALAAMPVPAQPTVLAVYQYVQKLKAILFHAPQAALAELCRRVVEATQGLLQQAPPAESQAIPANEQMKASAMVCHFHSVRAPIRQFLTAVNFLKHLATCQGFNTRPLSRTEQD